MLYSAPTHPGILHTPTHHEGPRAVLDPLVQPPSGLTPCKHIFGLTVTLSTHQPCSPRASSTSQSFSLVPHRGLRTPNFTPLLTCSPSRLLSCTLASAGSTLWGGHRSGRPPETVRRVDTPSQQRWSRGALSYGRHPAEGSAAPMHSPPQAETSVKIHRARAEVPQPQGSGPHRLVGDKCAHPDHRSLDAAAHMTQHHLFSQTLAHCQMDRDHEGQGAYLPLVVSYLVSSTG